MSETDGGGLHVKMKFHRTLDSFQSNGREFISYFLDPLQVIIRDCRSPATALVTDLPLYLLFFLLISIIIVFNVVLGIFFKFMAICFVDLL